MSIVHDIDLYCPKSGLTATVRFSKPWSGSVALNNDSETNEDTLRGRNGQIDLHYRSSKSGGADIKTCISFTMGVEGEYLDPDWTPAQIDAYHNSIMAQIARYVEDCLGGRWVTFMAEIHRFKDDDMGSFHSRYEAEDLFPERFKARKKRVKG